MDSKHEGNLEKFISHEIQLNVSLLAQGYYELKIVNRNKVIKTIHFRKK